MKLGIIDLGSNSLRFDIFSIRLNGKPKLLHREKDMIRVGDQVFTKQRFQKDAIGRLLSTLDRVRTKIKNEKIDHMICYGTSPFREARNAKALIQTIKQKTGLSFSILSGKKEAEMIAKVIMKTHPTQKKTILIDIGGGSTEITICRKNNILRQDSFQLGALRLQHAYLKTNPPTESAIHKLQNHIQIVLKDHYGARHMEIESAIGSAGTVKALLTVILGKKNSLSVPQLEHFSRKIKGLRLAPLKRLLKTEGQRGDIILAGTLLLLEILSFFHLRSIYVSKRSLRDGILIDYLDHAIPKR